MRTQVGLRTRRAILVWMPNDLEDIFPFPLSSAMMSELFFGGGVVLQLAKGLVFSNKLLLPCSSKFELFLLGILLPWM